VEPETRRFWVIALALGGGVLALLLFGRAQEELAPELERAWVAIEVGGSGVAKAGGVRVEPGTDFTLYAVLEATSWRGETVYFTEASRLEMPDGEVPAERLRKWGGGEETRVLWFSVEAAKPFAEIAEPAELESFEFKEFFLAGWPRTWTVSGKWSATSAGVRLPRGITDLPFGTRRFHVRIEIFGPDSEIRPLQRLGSLEGSDLRSHFETFPTVHSALVGVLGPPSTAFGLPQLELAPEAAEGTAQALASWRKERLAFSRLAVIRSALDAGGADPEKLEWSAVELTGSVPWLASGDLLRVGDRWVLTYRDLGKEGWLDYEDLCFDFDRGAAVRRLGDIFIGDGLVERASLERSPE
jgi:hypothetical protein